MYFSNYNVPMSHVMCMSDPRWYPPTLHRTYTIHYINILNRQKEFGRKSPNSQSNIKKAVKDSCTNLHNQKINGGPLKPIKPPNQKPPAEKNTQAPAQKPIHLAR